MNKKVRTLSWVRTPRNNRRDKQQNVSRSNSNNMERSEGSGCCERQDYREISLGNSGSASRDSRTEMREQKSGDPRTEVVGTLRGASTMKEERTIIAEVSQEELTRECGFIFNVADVAKPLASAVKVCQAGNRVVLDPEDGKSYVENISTGERMKLSIEKGTFVFEVQFSDDGEMGKITLDSGAGVSVWPKKLKTNLKMLPKDASLRMIAANGTPIENYGKKVIKFKGIQSAFSRRT
jgi:hypothetical protein